MHPINLCFLFNYLFIFYFKTKCAITLAFGTPFTSLVLLLFLDYAPIIIWISILLLHFSFLSLLSISLLLFGRVRLLKWEPKELD
jgi:hypothetical protein